MPRKSLALIILLPVLVFLGLAGTSLYFMIATYVEDFADRRIRENLSSLSTALYSIADRAVDELIIKGIIDDKRQIKRYKFKAFMETENFARQNEIGIIVHSVAENMTVFDTGVSDDIKKMITQFVRKREQKFSIPDRGNYYSRAVEFKPWNWRIILVKNASAYYSLLRNVRYIYLSTGFILLIIAAFLIVYLRRAIGRPINQIVTRLGEGKAPEYKGIKELEFLSDSFGQIMGSLKEKTLQLEATLDNMEETVASRTAELLLTNQRLEEAKLKAEAATHVKTRFLATMSHELRKPLNSIIGFTRLVKRKSKNIIPQKQHENLEKVLICSNDLLSLINDILDLTRLENFLFPIHPTEFTLEPLIDECLQTYEPIARGKQLQLVKVFEADQLVLFTDKDRVKQIFINLLDNAIKFTEKGEITVIVRASNEEMTIAVVDTGIGIPDEKQDLLFRDFQQLDDSSTRRHGGTGLGLSISRRLARLMGGDIAVESKQGVGSTFTVTIPVHYRAVQPDKHDDEALAHPEQALNPTEKHNNLDEIGDE